MRTIRHCITGSSPFRGVDQYVRQHSPLWESLGGGLLKAYPPCPFPIKFIASEKIFLTDRDYVILARENGPTHGLGMLPL